MKLYKSSFKKTAIIIAAFSLVLLSACSSNGLNLNIFNQNGVNDISDNLSLDKNSLIYSPFSQKFKTENYRLFIASNNNEVSNISIYSEELTIPYRETITVEGQVMGVYMTDLNSDNNNEFIIAVRPSDDSGNIDIIALATNNNTSISEVAVEEPLALRAVNSDKLSIIDGQLIRSFISNNELQAYQYKMSKGESSYILRAVKIE